MNKFNVIAAIAALATLTACTAEKMEAPATQGKIISLTSQVQTRAEADPQTTALSTDNTVGVFVNGDATYTNISHTVSANGDLTASSTMNYPSEDGAKVNIYAYAPYAEGTVLGSNNFSVATDQSENSGYLASDLLWAKVENQASSSSAVALNFAHKLSQLQIVIQNNAGTDLSNAVVSVTGTNTDATFDAATGAVAAAQTANVKDIKVATLTEAATVYAVVLPQTIAAETPLVKIVTTDKTYIAKLAATAALATGKAYKFTVTLNSSTDPVVEVPITLGSTSIVAWGNPEDLGSASMEEETTPPLYATFGTPGSNGSYDADTFTYSCTQSYSNLMNCFTFSNGELANYTKLVFTISDLSSNVRVNFNYGSGSNDNLNISSDKNGSNAIFGSNGTKTITMEYVATALATVEKTLADVTDIRFGGASTTASCVIKASEMYLE